LVESTLNFPKSKSAYILVETLISVAILSFGLISVLNAFSSTIHALRISKNYTHASLLLEEKLCELEKVGEISWDRRGENRVFDEKFRWEIDIGPVKDKEGNTLSDILKVAVTVQWDEVRVNPKIPAKRELTAITYMRKAR